MRIRNVTLATAGATLALFTAMAQGPAGDEVQITLDRPVQVGSQTLPAGDYTMRQVTSSSNPRVVEFTSRDGNKLDAAVTAIPVLQNDAPSKTRVIIDDEGGGARLHRIWVQGKNYGYEFPGNANPGTRTASASAVRMEGTFTAQPAVVANNTPPPAAAPEPTPAPRPAEPAPTPAPPPPPPPAAETPAPAPAPAPAPEPQPTMPSTADGWASMLLGGLALVAAAVALKIRSREA